MADTLKSTLSDYSYGYVSLEDLLFQFEGLSKEVDAELQDPEIELE